MSYEAQQFGDVYVLRWKETTLDDIEEVIKYVEAAAPRSSGFVYVSIVGAGTAPPGDDVRSEMMTALSSIAERCASVHVVVTGRGMRQAAFRSIASAFLLLKGTKNVFVDGSLAGALKAAKVDERTAQDILRKALEHGLIDPE